MLEAILVVVIGILVVAIVLLWICLQEQSELADWREREIQNLKQERDSARERADRYCKSSGNACDLINKIREKCVEFIDY